MPCVNCDCDQCKYDRRLKEIQDELARKLREVEQQLKDDDND